MCYIANKENIKKNYKEKNRTMTFTFVSYKIKYLFPFV